ncbi:hypothetical protein CDEST_10282 [Colletotrichum destructivum]|uniref:Uncharacterized protein n=1 Tax=Colletotrichum destructivum TaxID=34406 RepID=A0AAX4IQN0_9PEZI|nr:hypothetical protein CDEST_10282 [Colletotrichum destructivum]
MKNSDDLYGYCFCFASHSVAHIRILGRFCHFPPQPLGFNAALGRASRGKFDIQAGMILATGSLC